MKEQNDPDPYRRIDKGLHFLKRNTVQSVEQVYEQL